ncbi:MAG: dicarboxylate/amino acid:cation symporter [Chlamydiae bacterium]|nr:dicarboxylate/amino acid:cation symporter [Chlamydiota bacterium]
MSKKKKKSPWAVLIAIVLAFIIGNLTGTTTGLFGITFYSIYDLVGKLFIQSLTLIVVPLVVSSIVTGMARIGGDASFKRIGVKIIGFYVITTLSAVILGLLFVNLIKPGMAESFHLQIEQSQTNGLHHNLADHSNTVTISGLILSVIPSNIIDALAKGEMLALIFFSLLFGFALTKINEERSVQIQGLFQGLFQTMIEITHMIMNFLPFGVFCLVAKVAATTGFESLASLGLFFLTVICALAAFSFIVVPLLLKYIGKVSPKTHFKAMGPALITAFSTSSSSASLPITMDCVEKRAGVSNRICSLVVPLGTSLNMSGSALYEIIAAMFVAQVYGVTITLGSQIIFVMLALFTSMGVAGIPAASLVAVIVILKAFGLPIEGIGLFLAVDRILDMMRTTVNVLSDTCCAVLVAKSEGEKNILTKTDFSKIN